MNLLVVMSGLGGGGAEKSLVSFLATLRASHKKDIKVDLLVFKPEGLFLSQVPEGITWLSEPKECFCMSYPMTNAMFWKNVTLNGFCGKINHYLKLLQKSDSKEWNPENVGALGPLYSKDQKALRCCNILYARCTKLLCY